MIGEVYITFEGVWVNPLELAERLESELEPELDVAGAARTDERIAGGDVGCGAPAAERGAARQVNALSHASL